MNGHFLFLKRKRNSVQELTVLQNGNFIDANNQIVKEYCNVNWMLVGKFFTFKLKRFHAKSPSLFENFKELFKEDYIVRLKNDEIPYCASILIYYEHSKEIKLYQDNLLTPITLSDTLKKYGNIC